MPDIVGFHTNDAERCRKFISEDYVINCHDVQWLGYGMYFWDNLANAKYWLEEKKRKHPEISKWWIVQCEIDTTSLLDLTDQDILDYLDGLWNSYCDKKGCKRDQPLGKKIDMLFDFFEALNLFSVLKGVGTYQTIPRARFLGTSRIANNIKTIYCIRNGNSSIIYNRDLREVG